MRRLRPHRITGLALALALACASAPADAPRLVDAAALADGLLVDLRYAGAWWPFTLTDEPWPDRYFDRPVR